jgi:beta-ribofuranosylaminobenzene 5'-phosphate synthase
MASVETEGLGSAVLYDRVSVTTPSRLHFGLLDCGYGSQRLFGGVGVATSAVPTSVTAERIDEELDIQYEPTTELAPGLHMGDRAFDGVYNVLDRVLEAAKDADKLDTGVRLTIHSTAPEHMGLGSKTSLEMAVANAVGELLLSRKDRRLRPEVVRSFTARGGTSRIGVMTCQLGGFIFDDGHDSPSGEPRIFLPSSRRRPTDEPSVNARVELDENYVASLFYDPTTPRIDGQAEADIFTSCMPFSENECQSAIVAAYHGILPALLRKDMSALSRGLRDLNQTGLKAEEVKLQSDATQAWLQDGWSYDLPVGLSSFGPIVFAIDRRGTDEYEMAHVLAAEHHLTSLGTFHFNNHGAEVKANNLYQDVVARMMDRLDAAAAEDRTRRDRTRW